MTSSPVLLSGGHPQIANGDGEAAVQAYSGAMPEWKHRVGQRLDTLITEIGPDVRKGVRWNTPLYSFNEGWFLGFQFTTIYVKMAFFRGALFTPLPHPTRPFKCID